MHQEVIQASGIYGIAYGLCVTLLLLLLAAVSWNACRDSAPRRTIVMKAHVLNPVVLHICFVVTRTASVALQNPLTGLWGK